MHLSLCSGLLATAFYSFYLPAIVRGLPYSFNELIGRADVLLNPKIKGAHDDDTTASTGTQGTTIDASTDFTTRWPTIPDSGAHNAISDGLDPKRLPYINTALNEIGKKIPANRRRPVFFTDVSPPPGDRFIEDKLGGKAWDYFDAFPPGWEDSWGTRRGKDLSESEYWLLVNRASNAMARSNMEPKVFVGMDPENGARSIFNGVQQYDKYGRQTNKGVGQIFYQTELPVLMRNPNTKQIIAYYKDAQGNYRYSIEWDASWPRDHPKYKPRDYLPEMRLDNTNKAPALVPYSTKDGKAPQRWDDGFPHK